MHDTAHRAVDRCADLPPFQRKVVSMDGQLVDTSTACWCFRSSSDGGKVIPIPWARLDQPAILSDRARFLVKLFIADKISRKKARTIENDFRMFLRLQEWLGPARRSPFEWADLTEGWHAHFWRTASSTQRTKETISLGSGRSTVGELLDSIAISTPAYSAFCNRSRRWETPRDITCGSGTRSEDRSHRTNSC